LLIEEAALRRWLQRQNSAPASLEEESNAALEEATQQANWDAAENIIETLRAERRRRETPEVGRLRFMKARELQLKSVLGQLTADIGIEEQVLQSGSHTTGNIQTAQTGQTDGQTGASNCSRPTQQQPEHKRVVNVYTGC
jgi:hypothetical protein